MSDFLNKYPYTDFHELNLDWVIERVKKLTEDWLATQQEWNDTEEQWQQLHDYVMDYFANLDVQDEINNKINAMIADGTFLDIIRSTVEAQTITTTTDWLADHITQPTTPVVDTSLTIAGAAADAKTVGDLAFIDRFSEIPAGITSLAVLRKPGLYPINNSVIGNITDKPSDAPTATATVLVFYKSYNVGTASFYFIQWYMTLDQSRWSRILNYNSVTDTTTVYVDWQKIDDTSLSGYFVNQGNVPGPLLADCIKPGVYAISNAVAATLTDAPMGETETATIYVITPGFNITATTYYIIQLYYSAHASAYMRILRNAAGVTTVYKEWTLTAGCVGKSDYIALGDSITKGRLPDATINDVTIPGIVAMTNGYNLINKAVSGQGYVTQVNGEDATDVCNNTSFTGAKLVTMAYGTNDYYYNAPLADVRTNMRTCIDRILTNNGYCRLIIISPQNIKIGSAPDWALTRANSAGYTLQDYIDAIETVAAEYNLPVISLSKIGPVNHKNIEVLLADDGIHPNSRLYMELARTIAGYIKF